LDKVAKSNMKYILEKNYQCYKGKREQITWGIHLIITYTLNEDANDCFCEMLQCIKKWCEVCLPTESGTVRKKIIEIKAIRFNL